jgi:hypothetical protein
VFAGLRRYGVAFTLPMSARAVRQVPGFLALTWTFGVMQMIGVVAGIVSLVGVVLYLQGSPEGQGDLLRAGGPHGAHRPGPLVLAGPGGFRVAGTAYILGAAMAFAAASLTFSRLDPIPALPPAMLFRLPGPWLAVAADVLLMAGSVGAAQAQWRAQRTRVAEVMRLGG